VLFENTLYRAITSKASGGVKKPMWQLNDKGVISVMQPRTTKPVGVKDYLNNLSYGFIPSSRPLDESKSTYYIEHKNLLVLKKVKSSGATGVIVGRNVSAEKWQSSFEDAYTDSQAWQVQKYVEPGEGVVVGHNGAVPRNNKVLLGIFLVPEVNNPLKVAVDFSVKLYNGSSREIIFDPADKHDDIWFGNVVLASK